MEYTKRLYFVVYPNPTLIGSHYTPEEFSEHYICGSTRYYSGKLVFVEIDAAFRHPFLGIGKGLEEMKAHSDGRPKATRFIKSYRVMEHIDFSFMKEMYITTPDGACLRIPEATLPDLTNTGDIRLYVEINPLRMLVLSRLGLKEFGDYLTDPGNPKGAPMVGYTELTFGAETFLESFRDNPLMTTPVPGVHPSKLRDAIADLMAREQKKTKGLSLENKFSKIPYRKIRNGFVFARNGSFKYYGMPTAEEIETENLRFWRNM